MKNFRCKQAKEELSEKKFKSFKFEMLVHKEICLSFESYDILSQ